MYVNDEYEGVGTKWLFDSNIYDQGEWKKHFQYGKATKYCKDSINKTILLVYSNF